MMAHEVKMNVAPITAVGIKVRKCISHGMNATTRKMALIA